MRWGWAAAVVVAVGCGRVGYDAGSGGDAGSVVDGGAGDAGQADDGSVAGVCANASVPGELFRDGFESGFGAWDNVSSSAATATDPVHCGSFSLEKPADTLSGNVSWDIPAGSITQTFFVRAYVFVPLDLQNSDNTVLVEFRGSPKISLDLNPAGQPQLVALTDGRAPVASDALARDQWVCLEIELTIDAANGRVIAYADGFTIAALTNNADTEPDTPFTDIWFGQTFSINVSGTRFIYYDDIVIGTQRIGCE